MLTRGVLIRHLVLPGHIDNSKGVIRWINESFHGGSIMLSLMSQYTPNGKADMFGELGRSLTKKEYEEIEEFLLDTGIEDGYIQDMDSSGEEYIPDFDITPV